MLVYLNMVTYRKMAIIMTILILSVKLWYYNPFYGSSPISKLNIIRYRPTKSSIRLFSLNTYLRPPPISHCHGDCKEQRAYILSEIVPYFDIVLLQEVYGCLNFRCQHLIKKAKHCGLEYVYCNNYPTIFSRHIIGDALLILSRYPIIKTDSISFTQYVSYDSVMEKGCIYAKLLISPTLSIHVFNTHLQSTSAKYDSTAERIQAEQLHQIRSFINDKTKDDTSPIICAGDFNINAFNSSHTSKLYSMMSPLQDVFKGDSDPTIGIVYNSDGTEDIDTCLSCNLCKNHIESKAKSMMTTNRSINQTNNQITRQITTKHYNLPDYQRLDYVFWHQKTPKLSLRHRKILPLRLSSQKCNFNQLSDHSALLVEIDIK